MQSAHYQVKNEIIKKRRGKIVFSDDFRSFGTGVAVRHALSRLCKEEFIVRLSNGIYLYPKISKRIGIVYPSIEDIAKAIGISKELSDAWCDKHPNETEGTRYDRISKLSLFSRYLCNKGYLSYIPEIPKYKSSFVPYIFTKEEISLFFAACDRFKPNKISVESFHYIIPTFFRLLYGTDLRLGEVLTLLDKDVNVEEKYLIVRNSKNGTDRIVPMSDSLSNICMQYRAIREAQNTGQSSNLFFRKNNNTACCPASIYAVFRELLRMAGIPYNGKVHGPRTHDLRHTFVCHSLASMAETGMDIYHSLPILATYIGHRTIESTEKYARLTAEMYLGLLKNIEDSCSFIFPAITSNGSV